MVSRLLLCFGLRTPLEVFVQPWPQRYERAWRTETVDYNRGRGHAVKGVEDIEQNARQFSDLGEAERRAGCGRMNAATERATCQLLNVRNAVVERLTSNTNKGRETPIEGRL